MAQAGIQTVVGVIEPVVSSLELDLYDVELVGAGRARTLRVSIDRRDGDGVDLEAITRATEAISPVLDLDPTVAAALPGPYTLEVSSPGLERPLRTPEHFRRARGTTVSVKARGADGAVERERGVLLEVDDEGIDVEVDGDRRRFAYADVTQARTVFEWGAVDEPRPGRGRQKTPR